MLIYSVSLEIRKAEGTDAIKKILAKWLSRKLKFTISPRDLSGQTQKMNSGWRVQYVESFDSYPRLASLQFTHRDKETTGRDWVTEVGVRQETAESDIFCSVQLRTNEFSSISGEKPVQVTRPIFIEELVNLTTTSHGKRIRTIKETDASSLLAEIRNPKREYPIILISPEDGFYLVDPARILSQLTGLAEIIQIDPKANQIQLSRAIGEHFSAWLGGINIIYPPVLSEGVRRFPTFRFTPADIAKLTEKTKGVESKLLASVSHRTNLYFAKKHISFEIVDFMRLKASLTKSQAEKSGSLEEKIKLLELEIEGLKLKATEDDRRIQNINDELSMYNEGYDAKCAELAAKSEELIQLQARCATLEAGVQKTSERARGAVSEEVLGALRAFAAGTATLEQSLTAIQLLYTDRVQVLETARKAARDSASFKYAPQARDLIHKLVTNYWEMLRAGGGDAKAREIFGNSYAARESEVVENNAAAKRLRTFTYQGKPVTMFKHLKIGVKDSVAETMRLHFEWDSARQLIVIGHCGAHLDHG